MKPKKGAPVAALVLAIAFFAAACGSSGNNNAMGSGMGNGGGMDVDENDYGPWSNGGMGMGGGVSVSSYPYETVDATEQADLEALRQEEKLARDVYRFFYRKWGTVIFDRIGDSEQTHTDTVKALLDKYGIADPASDDTEGVFRDQKFADLYTSLTARGSASAAAAYQVGYDIEVLDIGDLDDALGRCDNRDITAVYTNLRAGSEMHQRAFSAWLQ